MRTSFCIHQTNTGYLLDEEVSKHWSLDDHRYQTVFGPNRTS